MTIFVKKSTKYPQAILTPDLHRRSVRKYCYSRQNLILCLYQPYIIIINRIYCPAESLAPLRSRMTKFHQNPCIGSRAMIISRSKNYKQFFACSGSIVACCRIRLLSEREVFSSLLAMLSAACANGPHGQLSAHAYACNSDSQTELFHVSNYGM